MKKIIVIGIICVLCSSFLSCAPSVAPEANPFSAPSRRIVAWSNMIPPQPAHFSSVEEMVTALKSRKLYAVKPELEGNMSFAEHEVAYMNMIYTLWTIGAFPIVEGYDVSSCSMMPQYEGEGTQVRYYLQLEGSNVIVIFYIKDTENIEQLNSMYEEKGVFVTVNDEEYQGVYWQSDDEDRTYFIFDYTDSYIMRVEVLERISKKEICEVIDGLQTSFVNLYYNNR